MKILLLIAVLIACTAYRSFAQEPVPLEVWTSVKSYGFDLIENTIGIGNRFAYIPNFRKGQSPHAFAISYREPNSDIQEPNKVYTWAFSKTDDTVNQFTWPRNFFPSATPDINGDGKRDFMNAAGMCYLGKENDEPDTSVVYSINAQGVGYAKLNNDNCDDIYYYGAGEAANPSLAHFIFGNKALQTFQKYTIISSHLLKDTASYEQPKSIYKNKQGQWRLLTHSYGWTRNQYGVVWLPRKSAMRLYSLDFIKVNEDSTAVQATIIHEYRDPKWLEHNPDTLLKNIYWLPFNDARLVYNSEHYPRILYYASINTVPDKETQKYTSYATIIDLTDDKIIPLNISVTEAVPECKILKHSIDGDMKEELYVKSGPFIYFYSIDSQGIPKNTLRLTLPEDRYKGGLRGLTSIDDINNDGINDIAVLSGDNNVGNYFAIVKGKSVISSISENPQYDFAIGNPYPLPNTRHIILPIQSHKKGFYSLFLYNMTGMKNTVFEQKEFDTGNTLYEFHTDTYPSGTYILRLTDGQHTVEKTILIQH